MKGKVRERERRGRNEIVEKRKVKRLGRLKIYGQTAKQTGYAYRHL